jgi:putative selenate reductase
MDLVPAKFSDLVRRLYAEMRGQDALFELPRKKWWVPENGEIDLSVTFHGKKAGNACGPAAGPQTQMAQNLVLSYLAGGRIMELKTVQVNDRLKIPRPCIDMTNVGYNVEWSQELLVEESLREYVAGMMLIEILRRDASFVGGAWAGPPGEVIYDLSVGYDLAGIKSDKVQGFLDGMRDASAVIANLRAEIPEQFEVARGLDFPKQISNTLTLSTFHGCPANEIEKICEFLIAERDLDVIVKMNPPMLGKDRLEHLLYDVMGYTELKVNPSAYTSGLLFEESLGLMSRLETFAKQHGRRVGAKFSNTLEVLNHKEFFTPDNQVQYLSGGPLHVITMTLTDVWRQAVGAHVPISFSAGIDNKNFPLAVACGMVPVTVCSDLLKPGGYGRMPPYLKSLSDAMTKVGARTIDDYVLDAFGQRENARGDVSMVGMLNTTLAAEKAREDARYRAPVNRKAPNRIDSHLHVFDCITCDKCIPVCPNAANFTYPSPLVNFEYHDLLVDSGGVRSADEVRKFEITRERQIANYADFCNECGNCDTFCPEYGGPFIEKPSFYGSITSWKKASPRDGFFVESDGGKSVIVGRIRGAEYRLTHSSGSYRYEDGIARVTIIGPEHRVASVEGSSGAEHRVDMWVYHTLRFLMHGVLDRSVVNQVNSSF